MTEIYAGTWTSGVVFLAELRVRESGSTRSCASLIAFDYCHVCHNGLLYVLCSLCFVVVMSYLDVLDVVLAIAVDF